LPDFDSGDSRTGKMAIQKPRTRLINFRVSEEEYEQLRQASTRSGARSLSEYARSAILRAFGADKSLECSPIICDLDRKVDEMHEAIGRLESKLTAAG
jgi:mobilization protein NikA